MKLGSNGFSPSKSLGSLQDPLTKRENPSGEGPDPHISPSFHYPSPPHSSSNLDRISSELDALIERSLELVKKPEETPPNDFFHRLFSKEIEEETLREFFEKEVDPSRFEPTSHPVAPEVGYIDIETRRRLYLSINALTDEKPTL